MKRISGIFALIICLYMASCKPDSFVDQDLGNVALSFNYDGGRMLVPTSDNYKKTSEVVTVPVRMSLSGPAPKIFKVGLTANADTVKTLIASNALPNTVALDNYEFGLPSSVEVPYGSTTFAVDVTIPTSIIEKYYGKKIAIAIKLNDPSRGNTLSADKKAVIVVINTSEIIGLNEIHNISFVNAGIVNVPTGSNYTSESTEILIPLDVALAGDVSEQFITTDIIANQDTINKLIVNNSLPANTVSLSSDDYSLPAPVLIIAKKSAATVNLRIKKAAMARNFDKKIALAFTLVNPSRFKVQATKNTVVVLVDPTKLVDDITGMMKNTARPFVASSKEAAGRWGVLADWTTNDAVNNHNGFGSYDNNASTNIAMESGWNGAPNITDGKIYQTITLPAGSYKYETVLRTGTTQNAYAVVAVGSTIPNTADIATALANKKLPSGTVSIPFVLTQPTQVSLGYVATLTGNQSVNIQSVKLVYVR